MIQKTVGFSSRPEFSGSQGIQTHNLLVSLPKPEPWSSSCPQVNEYSIHVMFFFFTVSCLCVPGWSGNFKNSAILKWVPSSALCLSSFHFENKNRMENLLVVSSRCFESLFPVRTWRHHDVILMILWQCHCNLPLLHQCVIFIWYLYSICTSTNELFDTSHVQLFWWKVSAAPCLNTETTSNQTPT